MEGSGGKRVFGEVSCCGRRKLRLGDPQWVTVIYFLGLIHAFGFVVIPDYLIEVSASTVRVSA